LKNAGAYERLWNFFASYVLVLSGSPELGLMVDQYHLWRTGRAVSTALLIVYLEVLFVLPRFFHTANLPWYDVLPMLALLFVAAMDHAADILAIVLHSVRIGVCDSGQTRIGREE